MSDYMTDLRLFERLLHTCGVLFFDLLDLGIIFALLSLQCEST